MMVLFTGKIFCLSVSIWLSRMNHYEELKFQKTLRYLKFGWRLLNLYETPLSTSDFFSYHPLIKGTNDDDDVSTYYMQTLISSA